MKKEQDREGTRGGADIQALGSVEPNDIDQIFIRLVFAVVYCGLKQKP
jgi:hypothetical protein